MRIIDPSFEILDQLDREPMAVRLEACGRVCYKSEDKITEESAVPFVERITANAHNSVLEMAAATFGITCHPDHVLEFYACRPKYIVADRTESGLLLSGSIRAFRELYQKYRNNQVVNDLISDLAKRYPYMFGDVFDADEALETDPDITVHKMMLDDVDRLPDELKIRHRFIGVRFVVNRAVTHELVRHRPCSFLQESQRYCRYSDDRFGQQVTFIKPVFFEEDSSEFTMWKEAMAETERVYLKLLETSTPQAARTVLPNSCKTEIIAYCNLEEWRHILQLRTSPAAEPSMREIMIPLDREMKKRFPQL
jgi:thymidylate synthase (FAD)